MDDNDQYIIHDEPDDNQLTKISQLGNEYIRLSNEVMQLENLLELRKRQLNIISSKELPDAMATIHMTEFKLMNGYRLRVKPILVCKLLKEKADEADQWLATHGHDGMVKRNLAIELPKTVDSESYQALTAAIEQQGFKYNDTKVIHPQTLNRWAREMEEEGEVIPEDIFSVFRGKKTEIAT
jgi:hypothetical protein